MKAGESEPEITTQINPLGWVKIGRRWWVIFRCRLTGERPPADAVPLSEVVKSLEEKGYSPVTEVSMDNGVWEVEAYKDGQERELKVNPKDGQVLAYSGVIRPSIPVQSGPPVPEQTGPAILV